MSQSSYSSGFSEPFSGNIKCNKISGSARVSRVNAKFAYLISENHGSIFVLPKAMIQEETEEIINDLNEFLRVDEVVHFTAVPQNGPNNCHWIATKVNKSSNVSADCSKFDEPDVIENVQGTVLDVYDRFGFIWSETYGRVYLPLSACFANNVQCNISEFQKLSDCFLTDDVVIFTAVRQPEVNGCRYAVVSIKLFAEESSNDTVDESNLLPMETGQVLKLFPQFGYIHCDKLGNVFFSLSNYVCAPGESPPLLLTDIFSEGDWVQFFPTPQPKKNECVWRACRVQVISACNVPIDFEDYVKYLKLDDSTVNNNDSSDIVMEVASQTDQSLWNNFLTDQLRRRPRSFATNSDGKKSAGVDVGCQTTNPPEVLLLKAIKSQDSFRQELKAKFPDLMKYVEKIAL